MNQCQFVEYLRAKAVRCRELAESASDDEAAAALRQMAEEMEIASFAFADSAVAEPENDDVPRRAREANV